MWDTVLCTCDSKQQEMALVHNIMPTHYHSQSDVKQGKIPDADSCFHELTTSHPNTRQSGLFFNKYEC